MMDRFLTHDNTFVWLLTDEQQQILFDKLKKMGEQSKAAKDQADKWIIKLAIACEKVSEVTFNLI